MRPILPALLLLGACSHLPAIQPLPPETRAIATQTEADLRFMLANLSDPAAVAAAASRIDSRTLAVVRAATASADASMVALGVTLRLCAGGVERFRAGFADAAAAADYANGRFTLGCLLPLAALGAIG